MERIYPLEELVVVENARREGSHHVALMTLSGKSSATQDQTALKWKRISLFMGKITLWC